MGAGRKTKSLTLKEKTQPSWTVNCSASARNLRKSDLGAVIFGCKNNTIEECYFKQLFGLPAPHFAYVKNVSPALPLFLFNYSDRKLHGIFEAASHGQMNIDPYGWTADGSEYTPYGAQVRVQIRMHCQPLNENQFRPVIAENYHEPRLFWFELDRAQTQKLISLFSSSPVSASASLPQNSAMWNTLFSASTSDTRGHDIDALVSQAGLMNLNQSDLQCDSWKEDEGTEKCEKELVMPKPNVMSSYASVLSSTTTSLPQKKWSALFKSPATCNTQKEDENIKACASEVKFPDSDKDDVEWAASYVALCLEEENQHFEDHPDESANFEEVRVDLKSESESTHPFALTEAASSFRQSSLWEDLIVDTRQEGEFFYAVDSNGNLPHSNKSIGERGSFSTTSHPYGESQSSEASRNDNVTEIHEELLHPKTNCECSHSSAVVKEMNSNGKHGKETVPPSAMAEVHPEDECFPEAVTAAEMKSSNIHSVVAKLLQEIEGLKVSQLKQDKKISSLELELVESKVEIRRLKTRFYKLDSGSLSSIGHVQEAANELFDEPRPRIDESILIVGGFDGSSWLSSLSSYFPSRDVMKSLKPMNFVRSYPSAATLNSELYIFGGVDGDVWHDTVESYNPASDQWVRRPSLNQKKGRLAGASLYGKIFAIGGGNGVECYSEVEVLDVNVGRWINTQAMLQKRLVPAAAEINGTLYVVGGYDGRNYLNSVERFDPREHSWMSLRSMSTRRGCHSLTVLNEKLYALGGFDGSKMVSTVEIYDPRHGSWMMGEPMNDVRGYSGAAVIGEKIFIIGGIKNNNEILSTIECYREGCGWELTNLKGVGKRCFFSATVL